VVKGGGAMGGWGLAGGYLASEFYYRGNMSLSCVAIGQLGKQLLQLEIRVTMVATGNNCYNGCIWQLDNESNNGGNWTSLSVVVTGPGVNDKINNWRTSRNWTMCPLWVVTGRALLVVATGRALLVETTGQHVLRGMYPY